jgi:hypothetical protein
MVGPEPYVVGSPANSKAALVTTQTLGLLPQNVVLTNANWWGIELDSYSTEDGCWNVSSSFKCGINQLN